MMRDGTKRRVNLATVAAASIAMLAVAAGCSNTNSRYSVAQAGQGTVTLREEQMPAPPPRAVETPSAGPTARETEMARKIEDLEAQSRAMESRSKELQAEIERLRREKK